MAVTSPFELESEEEPVSRLLLYACMKTWPPRLQGGLNFDEALDKWHREPPSLQKVRASGLSSAGCLPACRPACPACPPASLPAVRGHACLPACQTAWFQTCLQACFRPAWLRPSVHSLVW